MDAVQKVYDQNWLAYISAFPVAFAQVREDTLIDQWIVDQLPIGSQGIMIASGGCTAAVLQHMEKFDRLTLVDKNPAQLALSQLKSYLMCNYQPSERLSILGHQSLDLNTRKNYLLEAFNAIQCDSEILGPLDTVAELGPDHIGKYELLFKRLEFAINQPEKINLLLKLNTLEEQKQFLDSEALFLKDLNHAFQAVMSLPVLVTLFGTGATQNTVMPFSDHFNQRTLEAIKTLPAASNPFLSQLLKGQFTSDSIYPWLGLAQKSSNTEMAYCLATMADALLESKEQYDFIHLSNILDWLNKEQGTELLDVVSKRLKKNGWLIIRQLNSNLDIQGLQTKLHWESALSKKLHQEDRSFFYQKLHIARML